MHSGKYISFSISTPALHPPSIYSPSEAPLLYSSSPNTRHISDMPSNLPEHAAAADLRTAPRDEVMQPHTTPQPAARERRATSSNFSLLPESSLS